MIYSNNPRPESLKSLSDVIHVPFWLDDPAKPHPEPQLTQNISTNLLIIGAGAIGVEFAYFYNALGTKVTLVEMMPRILPIEDHEVADQ